MRIRDETGAAAAGRSLDDAQLPADLREGGDRVPQLLARVRRGQLHPDPREALGNHGVREANHVDAPLEELVAHFLVGRGGAASARSETCARPYFPRESPPGSAAYRGQARVPEHDGHDRVVALADVEAFLYADPRAMKRVVVGTHHRSTVGMGKM